MNGTVKEWLDKAEGDFHTALREMKAIESPNFDAVCFHAQQCVEKLMKALMIERQTIPPKTHDLLQLNHSLVPLYSGWTWPEEELCFLTRSSIDFRYPGETADFDEAKTALDIAAKMRGKLLSFI